MENKFAKGDMVAFTNGQMIYPKSWHYRDDYFVVHKVVEDGYIVRSMYLIEQFEDDFEYEYLHVTKDGIRSLRVEHGSPILM